LLGWAFRPRNTAKNEPYQSRDREKL
ncbi:MAG: hypothetical protein JWP63_5253, partial [Candidatus Solibacter sp.]|nr:hypothetical protein [Candidatus Solibacter sp.]